MNEQMNKSKPLFEKLFFNFLESKYLFYIFICIMLWFPQPARSQQKNTCITCHQEEIDEDNTRLVEDFQKSVHATRGIGCEGCHGGDPSAEDAEDAMNKAAGYVGIPARYQIPAMCAKCHANPSYMRKFNPNMSTDQYSKYLISGHGKRLTQHRDPKVAVCTSCHGVHNILAPNDPTSPVFTLNIPYTCAKCHGDSLYMAGRNIPTNQFALYSTSVHGEALLKRDDRAAPTCAGCHGSHEARRPDRSGVANTCAQCHNYNRELFVASPHEAAFERNKYAECEVCHSNHAIMKTSDDMLLSDSVGVCRKCHDEGSKGLVAAALMKAAIDSLKMSISSARQVVELARTYGMNTDETEYELRLADNKLVQSRGLIHAFSSDKVSSATHEGITLAAQASAAGQGLMEQYNFRRRGFLLSVVVILVLSALLTMKIRSLD